MPNKTQIAKSVAKTVVGTSVGFITGSIIKNNVPTDKRRHKAEAVVGGFVLGGMAAEAAEDWTDRKIDDAIKIWTDMVEQMKTVQN